MWEHWNPAGSSGSNDYWWCLAKYQSSNTKDSWLSDLEEALIYGTRASASATTKAPERGTPPSKDEISFCRSLPSPAGRDSCSGSIGCCVPDSTEGLGSWDASPPSPSRHLCWVPVILSIWKLTLPNLRGHPPPALSLADCWNQFHVYDLSGNATWGWGVWNYFKVQVLKITGNFDPLGRFATTGLSPESLR